MAGKPGMGGDDRNAYCPSEEEIRLRAARIRKDWSPQKLAIRSGGQAQPVGIPEYYTADLLAEHFQDVSGR